MVREENMIYTPMADILPEGRIGEAEVQRLVIGKKEAEYTRLRAAITGGRDAAIQEGTYTRLFVDGVLMMSDTQMERNSNLDIVQMARGKVLIAGLGLGMVLIPLAAKAEVYTITVVEKSLDVIRLVTPHIRKALGKECKLDVVQGDIFQWKPFDGMTWDTIYFDIWPNLSTDTLKEMGKLHRRFKQYLDPNGWMDSWRRNQLQRQSRRGG